MALAAPVTAAPITYLIDFQLRTGSALPSGRFTYDAGTTTFSDFLIEWDSINFDFTALANGGPEFVAAAPGVCGLPVLPTARSASLRFPSRRRGCCSLLDWRRWGWPPGGFDRGRGSKRVLESGDNVL